MTTADTKPDTAAVDRASMRSRHLLPGASDGDLRQVPSDLADFQSWTYNMLLRMDMRIGGANAGGSGDLRVSDFAPPSAPVAASMPASASSTAPLPSPAVVAPVSAPGAAAPATVAPAATVPASAEPAAPAAPAAAPSAAPASPSVTK